MLADSQGSVRVTSLKRDIRPRLQKMLLVQDQSQSTVEDLVREMYGFGWIAPPTTERGSLEKTAFGLTESGREALKLARSQETAFLRLLATRMQERYTIPGWFIARLWQINPHGGEVIIPAPLSDWLPASQEISVCSWDTTLEEQTVRVAQHSRKVFPDAFPLTDEVWVGAVRTAWERLSTLQPHEPKSQFYRPRRRLTTAMREASVKLLFDRIPYGDEIPDFPGDHSPLHPRTYLGWMPRLEALELLFYTDWHPRISGRLLFPTSVFRTTASAERFEPVQGVTHPDGRGLWLHQPYWEAIRTMFIDTLIQVHRVISRRVGANYVSLLDTRDEVCRQLRLSSRHFNRFLEKTLQELPGKDYPFGIGVETDVRAELTSGGGLLRHPVYLQGVPHTLIALAPLVHPYWGGSHEQ